ncbi:electron transport complex subunit RsxG [Arhodomonas aquaeolei]|uniref:electron transport complex subunit RsxG n=1 Tax=Arhodomonas aquaeolei TaxID=2369 RepID=UPI0003A77F25|nr:electron transport complex subunit RsxG [Arhodomonas aquaeolei]
MTEGTARGTVIAATVLTACALVGAALVALTHRETAPAIAANRESAVRERLTAVLPPGPFDRSPAQAPLQVRAPAALGSRDALPVYRAVRDGKVIAVVFTAVAPDGYGGAIRLLAGVQRDGGITGVRVIAHQETPGLGDAIEADRSDWIRQFHGRRLGAPPAEAWRVAADGGAFDAITGATITSRAVTGAVRRALVYFRAHRERLLTTDG